MRKYLVIYERSATGWGAYLPDLPGCVATGSTREIVERRIQEAVTAHIKGMRDDGLPIPEPSAADVGFMDVA
jgi:predicted RNase H-like HicB family nuclease